MPEYGEHPPKEMAWEKAREEVDSIADATGRGIDEGIKETVTAFQVNELLTVDSCEGGDKDQHGEPYPWIGVHAPEPEGWEDSDEKKEEWRAANALQRARAEELLEDFYATQTPPEDVRLVFEDIGIYGAFRVHSAGGETIKTLPPEEQEPKRAQYREEMNAFAAYLKSRFLLQE